MSIAKDGGAGALWPIRHAFCEAHTQPLHNKLVRLGHVNKQENTKNA